MEEPDAKLCEVCWTEGDGLAVQAHWYLSTIPVCDKHYDRVCQRCECRWATMWAPIAADSGKDSANDQNHYDLVCDPCCAILEREEKRREVYNQHLGSKDWQRLKKNLRRENRSEHGQVQCSRCGMSEIDNKHEYGEGLHGHHTSYDCFGQEKAGDVDLICTPCHAVEHHQPIPKPIRVSSGYHLLRNQKRSGI